MPDNTVANLASHLLRRKREALEVYRCFPEVESWHRSKARERVLRGGKRSGKTVAACMEVASAATGVPLKGPNGEKLPLQFPTNRPLLIWVIGFDEAHVGQTLHSALFEPGLLSLVVDKKTGLYRPFDWRRDAGREGEIVPSEPAIPERYIKEGREGFAWDSRARRIFDTCRLVNGNVIRAYPSTSPQAKQGDAVDLIWIDEDVFRAEHVKEWQDRLSSKNGRLIWSAWPHVTNEALLRMHERAVAQSAHEDPVVFETAIRFSDNPFITDKAKREAIDAMDDEDDRRSRDYGDFLTDSIQMYEYIDSVHSLPASSWEEFWYAIYNERKMFPASWTRYLAVDPSHQRTAIVCGVVPPQDIRLPNGNHVTAYDDPEKPVLLIERELVVKREDVNGIATAVRSVYAGLRFEAFIIDRRMGRQTPTGAAKNVKQQLSEAFAAQGIVSRQTGSGFADGCDVPSARRDMVRSMLMCRDRSPRLMLVKEGTPELRLEIKRFRKKRIGGVITEEPVTGAFDLIDALEYLVAHNPQYVPMEMYRSNGSAAYKEAMRMKAEEERTSNTFVNLGPPVQ